MVRSPSQLLRVRLPPPPVVLVGRDAERARIAERLAVVPVAVVCGVAGVGKTALALQLAAEWSGPVVFYKLVERTPRAELFEDLHRHLAAALPASRTELEGAIVDLLEHQGALWLIDDLHLLDPADQLALLELAGSLRRARLLATSREQPPLRPGDRDVLVVKLDALDEAHALALWAHLEELYGAAGSFDRAWARSRGNPFLLRQARVAPLDRDSPLESAWSALSDDERRVATALGLAHVRLPVDTIAALLPEDRGRAALRALGSRLVVEIDLDRGCSVHDLFRELALARTPADEQRALQAALARELRGAAIDPIERAREVGRLLVEVGAPAEAGAYLLAQSAELIRRGAAVELLGGFDAIPAAARTPEVQIARARTRIRMLELRGAADDLDRVPPVDGAARLELALAAGQLAVLLGRGARAERLLDEVLAAPGAPAGLRTRALVGLAVLRTYQGLGSVARELLDEGEALLGDAHHRAQLSIARAITFWIEEHKPETVECLQRALDLVPAGEGGFRASVVARSLLGAALAGRGGFDHAAALIRRAEESLGAHTDLRVRSDFRGVRATLAFESGRRHEARAALETVAHVFERAGYQPARGWARAWLGRVLLSLGRRREALVNLAEAHAVARATGFAAIAETATRSLAEDPLSPAWLARPPCGDLARPTEVVRSSLAAALRAAAAGDAAQAHHLLERAAPPGDDDHALDRALATLVHAVLARASGDPARAAQLVRTATAAAVAGGADSDVIPALFELVGRVDRQLDRGPDRQLDRRREPTEPPREAAAAAPHDLVHDLVVDAHEHVIHAAGRTIALAKTPRLRAALYALASAPAHALDKDTLARALWGTSYDPSAHDHALKANMHRLRRLLDGTGAALTSDDGGYRLALPGRLLFIKGRA